MSNTTNYVNEIIEDASKKYDVLVDTVAFSKKPSGKQSAKITNRLPHNRQSLTIEQIANLVASGHSWKASVLSGTSNKSFVSTIDILEHATSVLSPGIPDRFL